MHHSITLSSRAKLDQVLGILLKSVVTVQIPSRLAAIRHNCFRGVPNLFSLVNVCSWFKRSHCYVPLWQYSRICYIINKLVSEHKFAMAIVRQLVLVMVKHNIDLKGKHVPGANNIICDRISCSQSVSHLLVSMMQRKLPIPPTYYHKTFFFNREILSEQ